MLTLTLNYHLAIIVPQSFGSATTTSARSNTSATSSTEILQTGSLVSSYALGWTIETLFCMVSPSSISGGSSESRTHWHILSAQYRTGHPALVYYDPYTCFQLRNASPTKLQRLLSRPDFTTNRFTLLNYVSSRAPRSTDKLLLVEPGIKTLTASRTLRVAGRHIWNALPLSIRSAPSIGSFRDRLNPLDAK